MELWQSWYIYYIRSANTARCRAEGGCRDGLWVGAGTRSHATYTLKKLRINDKHTCLQHNLYVWCWQHKAFTGLGQSHSSSNASAQLHRHGRHVTRLQHACDRAENYSSSYTEKRTEKKEKERKRKTEEERKTIETKQPWGKI